MALRAAEAQPDGAVLLTVNVLVAPGARLMIDAPGSSVRLRSEPSGFVSLVAWKAGLSLSGAAGAPLRVSSWDRDRQSVDSDVRDGRAYIRDVSGDMQIRDVYASDLGFWAGRTSGVAWTGSARTAATGSIAASVFSANHYGAFVSRGADLSVTGSSFVRNAVDGLSLHRGTATTTIRSTSALDNGRHGFSAAKGSVGLALTHVTAAGNAAYGIYFDGTALSEGASVGGASLRTYGGIEIAGGVLRNNGKAALRVVNGNDVSVRGTRVMDNRDGIVLADTAAPTTVQDVVVGGRHRLGISVTGGAAAVSDNRVIGAQTAIQVRDATAAVTENVVAGASNHAVSMVGEASGSSLVDNTISGRGPSGLDVYRLDPGVTVGQSGNDVRGWTRDRDDWAYWSTFIPNHPMMLLWVVLLGLPLAFARQNRRRRIPAGHRALPGPPPARRGRAAQGGRRPPGSRRGAGMIGAVLRRPRPYRGWMLGRAVLFTVVGLLALTACDRSPGPEQQDQGSASSTSTATPGTAPSAAPTSEPASRPRPRPRWRARAATSWPCPTPIPCSRRSTMLRPARSSGWRTAGTRATSSRRRARAPMPRSGCAAAGTPSSTAGDVDGDYTLHLSGAAYWLVSGFTVTGGQKGVMVDAGVGHRIEGLLVTSMGDEAIHLRSHSTDNVVVGNTIRDTGLRKPKFGEGIYIGSAESNWCQLTECQPDRSDRNLIEGNDIAGTTAEAVDIKEGTSNGVVRGNVFDGSAMVEADSWVDVKGNAWTIEDNTGTSQPGGRLPGARGRRRLGTEHRLLRATRRPCTRRDTRSTSPARARCATPRGSAATTSPRAQAVA